MANLNYNQEVLIGDQVVNVQRREVISDRVWSIFKTVMVYIGGILMFWTLGFSMYTCGQSHPDCRENCQPIATDTGPTKKTETQSNVATVSGIDRLASAVEKLADTKPTTTTASAASATTTNTAVQPSVVVVKVPEHVTVEVKGLTPPPQPQVEPVLQAPVVQPQSPADPTDNMTPAQRCDYQVIVLRKARCSQ